MTNNADRVGVPERWGTSIPDSSVLIVDFGSQFTQLIARRIRELGIYSVIVPFSEIGDFFEVSSDKIGAIVLSGSPSSTLVDSYYSVPDEVFDSMLPILGICYGQQLLALRYGGKIINSDKREFGRTAINIQHSSRLLHGIPISDKNEMNVWMSHGDSISHLPPFFNVIASSEGAPYAIFANEDRCIYGVQFHPEVEHTEYGCEILRNFILDIAGLSCNWKMSSYCQGAIDNIRSKVGSDKVVCGVSGGIDSTVTAALVNQAIGDQLSCIFVDTGMMRKNEANQVVNLFNAGLDVNLIKVDAGDRFFDALHGVVDPEIKRKTIGNLFVKIFEEEAKKMQGEIRFLAQGTLYPDVIESMSFYGGPSATIKSHHNVGGLPEDMDLELLEPIRDLFKDEVRELARELGISEPWLRRHPFPGPGMAIRIMGEVTPDSVKLLQEVDDIYINCIREAGLYDEIWQAFAVLLPIKTVGVMGDSRTYENVCALRAVTSSDGMTADFYPFSSQILSAISSKIINNVSGINRVVYDVTSKPPGTIEWE